jgi:uncharacterized protein
VLLDTGVLVGLFDRNDTWHQPATRWLAGFDGALHTVDAVLTEAAFFLPASERARLATLATSPVLQVHALGPKAYARMAELMRKYTDQDPDWADVALIWLAEQLGVERIATVDQRDFGIYRIHGRRKFQLELL